MLTVLTKSVQSEKMPAHKLTKAFTLPATYRQTAQLALGRVEKAFLLKITRLNEAYTHRQITRFQLKKARKALLHEAAAILTPPTGSDTPVQILTSLRRHATHQHKNSRAFSAVDYIDKITVMIGPAQIIALSFALWSLCC